jgi:DNA mismatch repair ATPase MutS
MISDKDYEMVMDAVKEALDHYRTTNLDYYLKTLGDIEKTLRRAMSEEMDRME